MAIHISEQRMQGRRWITMIDEIEYLSCTADSRSRLSPPLPDAYFGNCPNISFPMHKLRGTFMLSDAEVMKLKNSVTFKKPCMAQVSYFTIVCARVWSCLVYSAACAGEKVSDDEQEYLSVPADCRARLTPALPDTYFGNCLILVLAECAHGRLKGSDDGWGGLKKLEALHIDISGSVSLCKTRDGVEVGVSLSKSKMDAFASIFNKKTYHDQIYSML